MKNEEILDSLKVIKCQHVSLEVSNVDVSLKFYRDFLGLKLSERHYANENPAIPFEMAFMRLGKQHHDLVLTHDPKRDYPEKIFILVLPEFIIMHLNVQIKKVSTCIWKGQRKCH